MYKIGWFSSGRGQGSRALLTSVWKSIESGDLKAHISFVFCNREPGQSEETDKFLDLVKSYNIPLICFSSVRFREDLSRTEGPGTLAEWRVAYDRQVMEQLEQFEQDICVLAGYMLVVGPEMCRRYGMINLHPALPGGPQGTWREVIWQLIGENAHETGVMMHLATPDLDEGPPVTYCKFPIRGPLFDKLWDEISGLTISEIKARQGEQNALFMRVREEGVKRELPLIITTLKAFSEGRIRIEKGRVTDCVGNPIEACSLTGEIERILRSKP